MQKICEFLITEIHEMQKKKLYARYVNKPDTRQFMV